MYLVARPRSPVLAPLVAAIGYHASDPPPGRERIMPSGDTCLMVNLAEDEFRDYDGPVVRRTPGAMLLGPRSGPVVIDTEEQRRGLTVMFTTGGAAAFLGLPVSAAQGEMVGLGDLWGRDGAVLRELLCEAADPREMVRMLEHVLLERLVGPLDPAVAFAAKAFERGAAVSAVTERVGGSPKRFTTRFREQVGLSPKRYSRVRRLQRLLADTHAAGRVDWAEVAVRHGFFDQAHLINDFRALTGLTPAAYLAAVGTERNHVPLG